MKKRTKEEEAAYKRELRERRRLVNVPPNVPPAVESVPPGQDFVPPSEKSPTLPIPPDAECPTDVPPCEGCLDRDSYIEELEQKIKDWDVRTAIIRGHIASAEKRADLAEKELAGYKRGGMAKPQSAYKGF